jgi:alpha-glucosidase (family GH31 glycosyl hydrolase)
MKRYSWCSFTWDPEAFPDPKKYLAEVKKKFNVKICVWINSYISEFGTTTAP